jgi:lipoprotein-anchoring transpeptidase ErfK/SrfK
MRRRHFLLGAFTGLAAAAGPAKAANDPLFWFDDPDRVNDDEAYFEWRRKVRERRLKLRQKQVRAKVKPAKKTKVLKAKPVAYEGRREVSYFTLEKPGTIIIKTRERALYQIRGGGRAMRYLVAVGKEGFSWSGTAKVGFKRVNPTWTPPAEMIERKPEYAEWADGMPGGIPENPLGVRAMYLYRDGRDTLFRIHGTNNPSSIGTAASSGCIRMLNREVVELYNNTPVGTKVIVR